MVYIIFKRYLARGNGPPVRPTRNPAMWVNRCIKMWTYLWAGGR